MGAPAICHAAARQTNQATLDRRARTSIRGTPCSAAGPAAPCCRCPLRSPRFVARTAATAGLRAGYGGGGTEHSWWVKAWGVYVWQGIAPREARRWHLAAATPRCTGRPASSPCRCRAQLQHQPRRAAPYLLSSVGSAEKGGRPREFLILIEPSQPPRSVPGLCC